MAKLWRLDSETAGIGGALAEFPSGKRLQIQWAGGPISPVNEAAKSYSASVLQRLLDEGLTDDAERTNWPSFTAALGRILGEFNAQVNEH